MYANVAVSKAQGKDWNSSQFLFDPTDAAYVKDHWIYLDHDQTVERLFRRIVSLGKRVMAARESMWMRFMASGLRAGRRRYGGWYANW